MTKSNKCCFSSTLQSFLSTDSSTWLETMKTNFRSILDLDLEESQIRAWRDCYRVLQDQLPPFAESHPGFGIIFEYVLPYESGRRPDVLLVSKEQVIVLEFKQKFSVFHADVDQAAAYGRDLSEYHYETRNCKVDVVLVLTGTTGLELDQITDSNIGLCSKDALTDALRRLVCDITTPRDLDEWMDSRYEPLPTIVEAAKMFVRHEELPNIRRVNSTCIPQAIECLKEVSAYAPREKNTLWPLLPVFLVRAKHFLGSSMFMTCVRTMRT